MPKKKPNTGKFQQGGLLFMKRTPGSTGNIEVPRLTPGITAPVWVNSILYPDPDDPSKTISVPRDADINVVDGKITGYDNPPDESDNDTGQYIGEGTTTISEYTVIGNEAEAQNDANTVVQGNSFIEDSKDENTGEDTLEVYGCGGLSEKDIETVTDIMSGETDTTELPDILRNPFTLNVLLECLNIQTIRHQINVGDENNRDSALGNVFTL